MELVPRSRGRTEFETFVEQHSDDLVRTGYLIAWDLAEAEDLSQECLMRVARRWSRVRRMDNPYLYARRVLVNLAVDGAKRRSRRARELSRPELGTADQTIPDLAEERGTRDELLSAMAALTSRQRAMVVLRYFEDMTEAQVAELLRCSAGNVKSSTARALDRLRQTLAPSDDASNNCAPTMSPTDKERIP